MATETFTSTLPETSDTQRDREGKLLQAITTGGAGSGGTNSGASTPINDDITAGGTAQVLQVATARTLFSFRNTSAGVLMLGYDGTTPSATVGQTVRAGEGWENPPHWCPQGEIKVWGATTGQTFEALIA